MQYGIGCSIVDIAHQFFFAHWGLVLELTIFISPSTESTNGSGFICVLKEKQKGRYKIMSTLATPQRYYSSICKPSSLRLSLLSQSKVFSHFQSI